MYLGTVTQCNLFIAHDSTLPTVIVASITTPTNQSLGYLSNNANQYQ